MWRFLLELVLIRKSREHFLNEQHTQGKGQNIVLTFPRNTEYNIRNLHVDDS